ncbi:MAG TPA: FGGY-family carbohydrate kinase [Spirochaetia bacterium]|nr:FGGY-family carbohydrate kinase [Spirochaetia bacterium]
MYLIGLDVGTTGCKALIFSPGGKIEGYGFREYGILSTEPGMAEQDAEEVWRITCDVLNQALNQVSANGIRSTEMRALSLSVQGDAVIPVQQDFNPVYNAVLGMDYRSQKQAVACGELFGDRHLFDVTGMRPHPINSLIKILWLKENRPEAFHEAWKITTYADFILGKLGAEPVIDFTMASRTMAFDLHGRQWSVEILDQLDIDPELFSTPVSSGTIVGKVGKRAAEMTGLPQGLSLVTGGHDQTCAALGAGVTNRGRGVVSTGTAEVLSTAFDDPALNDAMFESYYPCYRYVKPDMYFTFALNHIGGLLLRWYRDNFANAELAEARAAGEDPYQHILQKVPREPSRLFVLPHFNGSGTPWCDMESKGAILGLDLSTTRHDIARAILESQSYELRINLEVMEKAGVTVRELRAVGGGAKSPLWLQIKADILNRPISTPKTREAACLGAALLAGTAIGVFSSLDSAVEQNVSVERTYTPEKKQAAWYQERFTTYQDVYPILAPLNRKL